MPYTLQVVLDTGSLYGLVVSSWIGYALAWLRLVRVIRIVTDWWLYLQSVTSQAQLHAANCWQQWRISHNNKQRDFNSNGNKWSNNFDEKLIIITIIIIIIIIFGSRPSDHYFPIVCWFVCLVVCLLFVQSFSQPTFNPISIKLGHMLYVWV